MNSLKAALTVAMAAILCSGCAPEEKPEGVIPEGYQGALEKAQGVEGTLEQSMQLRDQEMENSER